MTTTQEHSRPGRRTWRVGQLADATGVTVRTLHHWDELGLVTPSGREPNGYRLYAESDVRRLYQVLALKALGLPLADIAEVLDGELDLPGLLRRHLDAVERELAEATALRDRLAALVSALDERGEPDTHELLDLMEHMAMVERYYTQEQLDELASRREALGADGMAKAERDWAELIADAQAARADGVEPADPRAQALARRWHALIEAFTGGDPGIRANLQRVYDEEGPERASRGMADPDLMGYMGEAMQAAGLTPPGPPRG